MNKKKLTALCVSLAMLIIAVVGGTMAYFTDTDQADNVFTVGNVKIDLQEPNWDSEGEEDAPELYPGEAIAKDPQVENTGANPAFVRIKVEWPEGFEDVLDIRTSGVVGAYNKADWTLHTDGYYYYNGVLPVGETTGVLFDHVVLSTTVENDDAATEYDIKVTAEAVQAQGAKPSFSAVEQMTVPEIAAWFKTCMK